MAKTTYWTGATDTDWDTAGNWSAGAPASTDTVIFDGRTTRNCLLNVDSTALDLAALYILPSYTGTIGASTQPLEIEVNGLLKIEGRGDYYIQCGGNGAADTNIVECYINVQNSSTVRLSSEKNASGGNVSLFDKITIASGTVTMAGKADTDLGNADGTAFTDLYIIGSGSPTVTIGDQCTNLKAGTAPAIYISGGTLNHHSTVTTLHNYGGTVNYGSSSYDQDAAGEDNITTLLQYAGTFKWAPQDTGVCSPSPAITTAHIFGGTFNGNSMLSTSTTAPTITSLYHYPKARIQLDNGYANFVVTTYYNRSGDDTTLTGGQAITYSQG